MRKCFKISLKYQSSEVQENFESQPQGQSKEIRTNAFRVRFFSVKAMPVMFCLRMGGKLGELVKES